MIFGGLGTLLVAKNLTSGAVYLCISSPTSSCRMFLNGYFSILVLLKINYFYWVLFLCQKGCIYLASCLDLKNCYAHCYSVLTQSTDSAISVWCHCLLFSYAFFYLWSLTSIIRNIFILQSCWIIGKRIRLFFYYYYF